MKKKDTAIYGQLNVRVAVSTGVKVMICIQKKKTRASLVSLLLAFYDPGNVPVTSPLGFYCPTTRAYLYPLSSCLS